MHLVTCPKRSEDNMGKQGPQTHPDRRQKKKPFQVGPKLAKGSYTGHSQ